MNEDKIVAFYLDLARIFLRFRFSLRILFLRHFARILDFCSGWKELNYCLE